MFCPGKNDRQVERRRVMGVFGRHGLAVLMLLATRSALAQEALQNSLAGDAAAESRSQAMGSPQVSQDYTFKQGDFRLLLMPAMGLDWNDNVNLSKTNALEDVIVMPSLGITLSYPFSENNLLYLNLAVGYDWYLNHPAWSSFDLNSTSGTGLSFDIDVKDITINLHDWISYVQGLGQNASVANTASSTVANSATYGTIQNTAGLSATWDLNQVKLSLGYDHQNVLATSSQFSQINHASEMLFARAGLQVHPKVTTGLESTAAFTAYDENLLNDNNTYTVGPYCEFRPDAFFKITVRGGYSTYQFQNTSTVIQTASQNSWYAGLTISHQATEFLTYSLEAGRESQFGVQSDLVEDWYVRPTLTWRVITGLDLLTSFFYEHGNQGVGSVGSLPGGSNETYDWYGGGLSLQHALTSRLTLGLTYRITVRSSSGLNDSYVQNLAGLQITYRPQ
jgi:hypothetical protein